jgi:glycerol-3-phosphate dehydrogenase subunit B
MRASLNYDVVVIGAGVAGLTAAARLADGGARVCVLAKGVGSTHLAPGTVGVLGYGPELVEEPARALPDFVARNPEHPYAVLATGSLAAALSWFAERVERGPKAGYRYVGGLERNMLLPTALGGARPSALVPETMAGGDMRSQEPVCVAGMRVLRDFHASLCAANLERSGVPARAVELRLDVGRAEANCLTLARRLDDPRLRAEVIAQLESKLRDGERLALPAALGLRDPHGAWSDLEQRLGRRVFEIPTLPPSVPGMRVYDILRAALRASGGRLVFGSEVVSAERQGERVTAVRAEASGHEVSYGARWVVLASGGVTSGAIALGSDWVARENVLGLPLQGAPAAGEARFSPGYFDHHPIARMGVAVDSSLIARGTDNVLVAGAALPGAEPWREGSGEGIALASGYEVAGTVLAQEAVAA